MNGLDNTVYSPVALLLLDLTTIFAGVTWYNHVQPNFEWLKHVKTKIFATKTSMFFIAKPSLLQSPRGLGGGFDVASTTDLAALAGVAAVQRGATQQTSEGVGGAGQGCGESLSDMFMGAQ